MIRPVKLGIASLKGLGAVVALGAVAHASMPYLPRIGPPPLRVQAVKTPAAAIVKSEATPVLPPASQPAVAEARLAPVVTNFPDLTKPAVAVVSAPPIPEGPDRSLGDTFTSSVFPMPAPDLLGITPQMLATYFHPVQLGTNSAAPTGPFQVIFMPPLPPDKSSHAEYIVK
jgi:hypothetical protein